MFVRTLVPVLSSNSKGAQMVLQRRVGCGATHKVGLNPELMNDHKYRGALVLGIQSPIRSLWRSRSMGEKLRDRKILITVTSRGQ